MNWSTDPVTGDVNAEEIEQVEDAEDSQVSRKGVNTSLIKSADFFTVLDDKRLQCTHPRCQMIYKPGSSTTTLTNHYIKTAKVNLAGHQARYQSAKENVTIVTKQASDFFKVYPF